jgi:hypothetical protein
MVIKGEWKLMLYDPDFDWDDQPFGIDPEFDWDEQ